MNWAEDYARGVPHVSLVLRDMGTDALECFARDLYQGTTSVVPYSAILDCGFSR